MSKRRIEVSNGTRTSTNSLSNSVSNSINDNVDDIQSILDGIIGEDYIIKETGIRDLKQIFFLKLIIDTSIQSVYELSDLLPNLKKLVLDNSNIVTIRDLGIGLKLITSLSLSNCGLNDIDGIGALQSLEELSLSNNSIADVTPLAMHENIKVRIIIFRIYQYCLMY